jgi:hypothetical protein
VTGVNSVNGVTGAVTGIATTADPTFTGTITGARVDAVHNLAAGYGVRIKAASGDASETTILRFTDSAGTSNKGIIYGDVNGDFYVLGADGGGRVMVAGAGIQGGVVTATLSGTATNISGTLDVTQGGTGATAVTGTGSNVLSSNPSFGSVIWGVQAAPATFSTGTLVSTDLTNGIVQLSGGPATLPAASNMNTRFTNALGSTPPTNSYLDWSAYNTSGATVTINDNGLHTIVGSRTLATGTSARFRCRRVSSTQFINYRIS